MADAIAAAYLGGANGRLADQAGVDYWANQVASGALTLVQAIEAIQRAKSSPDFWRGGYTGPGGMFEEAGTVHKGEVVWNQKDVARWGGWQTVDALRKGSADSLRGPELYVAGPSRRSGSDQGNSSLLAAINGLQDGLRAIAKHTMQTAKRVEFLERWDFDGLPEARKA